MMRIHTRKGLTLPITGAPRPALESGRPARTVALLGRDYPGLRPSVHVVSGQRVRRGEVVVEDRSTPGVVLTAPGSGTVREIRRGPRRTLEALIIALDSDEGEGVTFPACTPNELGHLPRETIVDRLVRSGLWTALRTRPFERIPDPKTAPASLFITAMDTRPLAPSVDAIVADARGPFHAGIEVVRRLTTGRVFLCCAAGSTVASMAREPVHAVTFDGPHPAGLVGTHVHHLDPVGTHKTVWHIGYADVIALGCLFTTGRVPVDRTIALAGPGVKEPRMLRTRAGASLDDLLEGELLPNAAPHRVISGSVLHGDLATATGAYLGRYHNQVSVLTEGVRATRPRTRWSAAGLFTRRGGGAPERPLTTARNGRPTAMVPVEAYEGVLPMDIVPAPLLRALLVGDLERAEALGALELCEEDLALLTYVCPAKIDYGPHLRAALDAIGREA